jgi:hypothetical protein
MPTMQPVANVLRIRYLFAISEDLNVEAASHFYWSGTAPSPSVLLEFAEAIYTEAAGLFAPLMSGYVQLTGVRVTDLTSTTAADATYSHTTVGTRSGYALPASTCALVNRQISRRYRGGKPRVYFPFGVAEDLNDSQTWAGAFKTQVDDAHAAIDGFISTQSSGGCLIGAHCTVSYYGPPYTIHTGTTGRVRMVPSAKIPPVVDVIVSAGMSLRPGSQRKRL